MSADSSPRRYAILGATGGIGSRLCAKLAAPGVKIALGARDTDRLDALAAELAAAGCETAVTALDATDAQRSERFVTEAAEAFGGLDGVCNCVGSILIKPAHLTSDDELERVLRQNLWSSFGVVRGAAKSMRKDGGSVVLMSTVAARAGLASHEAIAAAKGAVQSLAVSAASTYATNGIRFNAVAPGLTDTPGAAAITGNEMALKASTAMHPLGRIGKPAEVASMVAWLLGPDAGWVTGQVFGIDGGLSSVHQRVKV